MNWDWEKLQTKQRRIPKAKKADDNKKDTNDFDFFDREEDENTQKNGSFNNKPPRKKPNLNEALGSLNAPHFKWILLVLLAIWFATGIYIVRPDEAGVVLRFGKYNRTVNAGLNYHLPYPFETVYLPKVSQIRQAEVGFRSQSNLGVFKQGQSQTISEEASMLTGDENIVTIQFSIQYHIMPESAVDYLFNVTQPDAVVKKAAEAAMREVIGKTTLDAALTKDRLIIQEDVKTLLQNILNRYQLGIEVVAIQMQDVQPPIEVSEAFKDVASAREDKQRLTNEAESYRSDILPKAQGHATELVNQAEAYKATRILNAQGQATRFLAILKEYEKAPDVTEKRILLETLEEMLSQPGLDKVILPESMSGQSLPIIPIDMSKKAAALAPSLGLDTFSQQTEQSPSVEVPTEDFSRSARQTTRGTR